MKSIRWKRKKYEFDHISSRLSCIHPIKDFSMNVKAGNFYGDNISFVDYKHFNGNQNTLDKQMDKLKFVYCLIIRILTTVILKRIWNTNQGYIYE
jgi:hypothetical protein